MAVDTVNYDPSLEERLRHPIQHLYKASLLPVTGGSHALAVDGDLSVSFSLGWSPYAQASLTIKKPRDAAILAALDGRLRSYIRLELGYAFDGATTDIHEAVKIRLEDVTEKNGLMRLTLQGEEMEAQDADWNEGWNGLVPRTGIREFIEYVLEQSVTGSITLTGTGTGVRPDLVAEVNPSTGSDLWSIASGVADSAGLKLWHDGGTTWKLLPRYAIGSSYGTMLRTGKGGTITDVERRLSRTDWYNAVTLVFPDSLDGSGRPIVGSAAILTGPYSLNAAGKKAYTESIPGWANVASANARAAALLSTLSQRGSSYTIQAAAAYWIRPGMTVPVKTGRGPYEKQLVESVTFTPLNGLMTLHTIKNED